MSRHRFVRNLNIQDELDDDALSDGGDDGMTTEQHAQMEDALARVRDIMGDESVSRLDDQIIRDTLWECFFDVEQAIPWLYEEQERRAAADERRAAKERLKAQKAPQKKTPVPSGASTPVSRARSPVPASVLVTPSKAGKKSTPQTPGGKSKTGAGAAAAAAAASSASTSTPRKGYNNGAVDQREFDISALNLQSASEDAPEEAPLKVVTMEREKLLAEVRRSLEKKDGRRTAVSLVVIGHVDAGKSTLMGRLLYELDHVDEKTRMTNQRESTKAGKSSFGWAWEMDNTQEERNRGITMDIAQKSLTTPHRQVTVLDAPGHKDFIPNMISGASQADCALLVVDATTGEFEAGFERGGQTREHLLLVRSLGVAQVVVAVNKLDQVGWDRGRYEAICELLRPFLVQSGFSPAKTSFVPVGAVLGVNLASRESAEGRALSVWYEGPTLVDLLDKLEPPVRDINSPLRLPLSNVFKGQGSGIGVTGRICGGVVQVGERVRVLPGDESAIVKTIDVEDDSVPWAAAGTNVTMYLTGIDPIHLNVGTVLCPTDDIVPLATTFSARIIVFDVQLPITAGASVEIFHHSRDVPATVSKLVATLDRATGVVAKKNPRVLAKGVSAEVEISLRAGTLSGPTASAKPIPLETFAVNKDMGRILIRRGGETISAGIVLDILS